MIWEAPATVPALRKLLIAQAAPQANALAETPLALAAAGS
ncbi:hypothetical protein SF83666_c34600 [Sinorhizobium fredii CCBAU 83666]|nr:hypothetical protein SF83666_c34600 [Sinorhizobium fredii CCBAU 83666]